MALHPRRRSFSLNAEEFRTLHAGFQHSTVRCICSYTAIQVEPLFTGTKEIAQHMNTFRHNSKKSMVNLNLSSRCTDRNSYDSDFNYLVARWGHVRDNTIRCDSPLNHIHVDWADVPSTLRSSHLSKLFEDGHFCSHKNVLSLKILLPVLVSLRILC